MGEIIEAAALARNDPKSKTTPAILSETAAAVNALALGDALTAAGISPREAAQAVRDVFPGFDRFLLSKCTHPDKYGVELCRRATEALCAAWPQLRQEPQTVPQPRKQPNRRLPCRIYARLSQADYGRLQQAIAEDGYGTVQAWLEREVAIYLQRRSGHVL